jgi:predicted ATPase
MVVFSSSVSSVLMTRFLVFHEDLLSRLDVRHLMLIGAYRLMRKLEAIRQAGTVVHDIVLAPLIREDLGQLIADSLHCEPDRAAPLAQLVHEKTAGNPFFAIQAAVALGILTCRGVACRSAI